MNESDLRRIRIEHYSLLSWGFAAVLLTSYVAQKFGAGWWMLALAVIELIVVVAGSMLTAKALTAIMVKGKH